MVKIREAIVVEGRYDKNTLSPDAWMLHLQTSGFGIMKDRKMLELLRRTAKQRADRVHRLRWGGICDPQLSQGRHPGAVLKHAYIPDVYGKEKRKASPGKEGKLGVEGMTPQVILDALCAAGATIDGQSAQRTCGGISKQDLFQLGLSGCAGSDRRRKKLLEKLGMPEHMSANAMLQAINLLYTMEELTEIMEQIDD